MSIHRSVAFFSAVFLTALSGCSASVGPASTAVGSTTDLGEVSASAATPLNVEYGREGRTFTATTTDGVTDAYYEWIAKIPEPLPKGLAYPPGVPSDGVIFGGMNRQGVGRDIAWFTWICAWEGRYLDDYDAGNTSGVATAGAMLEKWVDMYFYREVFSDPDKNWVANVLGPMRHGDASGVRTDHKQSCYQTPTVVG